jgi:hypothetical protein
LRNARRARPGRDRAEEAEMLTSGGLKGRSVLRACEAGAC